MTFRFAAWVSDFLLAVENFNRTKCATRNLALRIERGELRKIATQEVRTKIKRATDNPVALSGLVEMLS
jgi:hypothetical protein